MFLGIWTFFVAPISACFPDCHSSAGHAPSRRLFKEELVCNFLQRARRNSEGGVSQSAAWIPSLPFTRDVWQLGDSDLDPVPSPPCAWLGMYYTAAALFAGWALQLLALMHANALGWINLPRCHLPPKVSERSLAVSRTMQMHCVTKSRSELHCA